MRVSLSKLREHVDLPEELTVDWVKESLAGAGIQVISVEDRRQTVRGSLVVGRVLTIDELTGFKKPIRYCTVDVGAANGTGEPQEIVCGATNFTVGDLVVVILPGGVLPGDLAVGARKAYGHSSNGMICSARELGTGEDHTGIVVVDPATGARPGEDARAFVGLNDIVIQVGEPADEVGPILADAVMHSLGQALNARRAIDG